MTKKPLAIILAFFIVFAPVYANAVLLPLLAVAASSTGRVLVGNAIKRVGQAALSRAGMAAMGAGLVGMAGTKSAIEQDGWTIEYGSGGGGAGGTWDAPNGGGVDSEGNIDISIYKLPPENQCDNAARIYSSSSIPTGNQPLGFLSSYQTYSSVDSAAQSVAPSNSTGIKDNQLDARAKLTASVNKLASDYDKSLVIPDRLNILSVGTARIYYPPANQQATIYGYVVLSSTVCPVNKTYITNNEFNAYLTKNITNNQAGDIIKNIYNYDYSQHPNITINNNTTGGNSLNNDLSLNVDPNADIKVSPRLRLDIESNKVNLDNVNDENCTKNEAGEYDNCTGEPDPEEEEETDPDDPNNPSPEEPPPIECSANGFYQKICDWMDWTKKEHTEPTDTNVDVTDKTSEIVIDDSRISFDDQCPTPKDIDITVVGHSFSDALDYQPLCDFFIKLKPFVVGMGGISSALIIAGGVRRG